MSDNGSDNNVIQVGNIFTELGIKHTPEAEQLFSLAFAYLLYLPVGGELSTAFVKFKKLSDDIIVVDSIAGKDILVDELVNKSIVRIPL